MMTMNLRTAHSRTPSGTVSCMHPSFSPSQPRVSASHCVCACAPSTVQVMDMNMGAIPAKKCCKPGTQVYYSDTFPSPGPFGDWFTSTDFGDTTYFGMLNTSNGFSGIGKVLLNDNAWVQCCEMDKSKKAWRTAFMVMFNTPYCVGFLAAVLLNLLLPEDMDVSAGEAPPPAAEPTVTKTEDVELSKA